jgi:hypothetical protein
MVNLRTIGEEPGPQTKNPPLGEPTGGHSCNFANLWGENRGAWVCIGFTPAGLGPMVASFFAFVNTFFTFLVIF